MKFETEDDEEAWRRLPISDEQKHQIIMDEASKTSQEIRALNKRITDLRAKEALSKTRDIEALKIEQAETQPLDSAQKPEQDLDQSTDTVE